MRRYLVFLAALFLAAPAFAQWTQDTLSETGISDYDQGITWTWDNSSTPLTPGAVLDASGCDGPGAKLTGSATSGGGTYTVQACDALVPTHCSDVSGFSGATPSGVHLAAGFYRVNLRTRGSGGHVTLTCTGSHTKTWDSVTNAWVVTPGSGGAGMDKVALTTDKAATRWDSGNSRLATTDCVWQADPDNTGHYVGVNCPAATNSGQSLVLKEADASIGTESFTLQAPVNATSSRTATLTPDMKIPDTALAITYTSCGIFGFPDQISQLEALGYISLADTEVWPFFMPPVDVHVTGFRCRTDGAAITVQILRMDGSPANMLSSATACLGVTANSFASGEDAISSTMAVAIDPVTTDGTTSFISWCIDYTKD